MDDRVNFMIRIGVISLVGLFLCLVTGVAAAQSSSGKLMMGIKAQDLSMPVYDRKTRTLTTIIHVDKIFTEHEKRGFFRIGLLPVKVMDGVSFDIKESDALTTVAERMTELSGSSGSSRAELRHVKIGIGPDTHLNVGRVRMAPGGRLELSDGIQLGGGTNLVQAERGTLSACGPKAGTLVLALNPPLTNFLFSSVLTQQTQSIKPTATAE